MARRLYLAVLGLACVVLGLLWLIAGGAGGLGKNRVEISFWNGWTGPDGRAALRMIRRFNQANPDIEVSMQRIDWANYYNKLMVSAIDNRGPQVFVIHASTLPRMMRAGFVADASDMYGVATGILPSDFPKCWMRLRLAISASRFRSIYTRRACTATQSCFETPG